MLLVMTKSNHIRSLHKVVAYAIISVVFKRLWLSKAEMRKLMIKSMTGYGRAEIQDSDKKFTVEIKSVNHRYLDFNFRMPKKLSSFEASIRNLLKEYMQRGKVDVFIFYEDYTKERVAIQYNKEMARQYLTYFKAMSEDFDLDNNVRVSELSRYPEVLAIEEQPVDEKELWEMLAKALQEAATAFAVSREVEGKTLKGDLLDKLNSMDALTRQVEERAPEIATEYRTKIEGKVKELLADTQIEEGRIATEVVFFADKICTDEETVRLRSHIDNVKKVLDEGQGIGRKLDFIAQEMNREANTILSKANDLLTSNKAIDLKTEIEKLREQIQNIE